MTTDDIDRAACVALGRDTHGDYLLAVAAQLDEEPETTFWEVATRYGDVVKLRHANAPAVLQTPRRVTPGGSQMQPQYTPAPDWSDSVVARFWSKVDRNGPVPEHRPDLGPCWLWTASTSAGGYGKIGVRTGATMDAHKVSWVLHFGPIRDALWVLHACDVPRCVRPAHLFLGTVGDNNRDMFAKGRGHSVSGWARDFDRCQSCQSTDRRHWGNGLCKRCYARQRFVPKRIPRMVCAKGHRLEGANLYLWRGHRICKTCRRERYPLDWQQAKARRVNA